MQIHAIRRTNLIAIKAQLESRGFCTPAAQARVLGSALTPRRLQGAFDGKPVGSFAARAIEHALSLPVRWLDAPHDDASDAIADRLGAVPFLEDVVAAG